VEADPFEESLFFAAIASSGARVLLIGRRALVALGLPVLTADYDLWTFPADVEKLNTAVKPLDLVPNRTPDEARSRGRYVLENGEHVDVLLSLTIAGSVPSLSLADAWTRRTSVAVSGVDVHLPALEDLLTMKRAAGRQKDTLDVALLESYRARRGDHS
jgi:hypothetical protein